MLEINIRIKDVVKIPDVKSATTASIKLHGCAPNILDGVRLKVGDRVLVKNQKFTSENGIYIVLDLGDGYNGVWIRVNSDLPLSTPVAMHVEEGVENGNSMWVSFLDINRKVWLRVSNIIE